MEEYERKKSELWEEIDNFEQKVESLKKQRKQTKKHISFEELPDEEQFYRIAPARKQLTDTVKMIAYRAETAMAHLLREYLGRKDDTRPLLRQIFKADIDLIPDDISQILTVRLHRLTNRQADNAVRSLCKHLNETET